MDFRRSHLHTDAGARTKTIRNRGRGFNGIPDLDVLVFQALTLRGGKVVTEVPQKWGVLNDV